MGRGVFLNLVSLLCGSRLPVADNRVSSLESTSSKTSNNTGSSSVTSERIEQLRRWPKAVSSIRDGKMRTSAVKHSIQEECTPLLRRRSPNSSVVECKDPRAVISRNEATQRKPSLTLRSTRARLSNTITNSPAKTQPPPPAPEKTRWQVAKEKLALSKAGAGRYRTLPTSSDSTAAPTPDNSETADATEPPRRSQLLVAKARKLLAETSSHLIRSPTPKNVSVPKKRDSALSCVRSDPPERKGILKKPTPSASRQVKQPTHGRRVAFQETPKVRRVKRWIDPSVHVFHDY